MGCCWHGALWNYAYRENLETFYVMQRILLIKRCLIWKCVIQHFLGKRSRSAMKDIFGRSRRPSYYCCQWLPYGKRKIYRISHSDLILRLCIWSIILEQLFLESSNTLQFFIYIFAIIVGLCVSSLLTRAILFSESILCILFFVSTNRRPALLLEIFPNKLSAHCGPTIKANFQTDI